MTDPARPWSWTIYAAALLAAACGVYLHLLADLDGSVFAGNDDSSLFVWWFAHAAMVVDDSGSDHSLLRTALMNAPHGVNGAWNTSVLGLAVPMVPFTLWLGPLVSYNLLIVVSPAISAFAAARSLRRFASMPAACAGGLLYGFSSYVIAQSAGHLNLSFAILPPIVLGAVHDVYTGTPGRRRPAWRIGIRLGLALAFQLYLSTELLASTALITALLLIVLGVLRRRLFLSRLRRLLESGVLAGLIVLLLGAPLLRTLLAGDGPRIPVRPLGVFQNDLLDILVPAKSTWLQSVPRPDFPAPEIDTAEFGLYLGIPLLVLAVVVTVGTWRSPDRRLRTIARAAVITGFIAWALSLGSELTVGGRETGLVLPWRLLESVPVLSNILPMRLAVFVTLSAAVLLALVADWMARRSLLLAVAAIVVALLFVLPAPVRTRPVIVPLFFTDGQAQRALSEGALVKTVPRPIAYAHPHADEAMVWQAMTGMRYRETGGYFIGSTAEEPLIYAAVPDAYDDVVDGAVDLGVLPPPGSAESRAAAAALKDRGIDDVLIVPSPALTLDPEDLAAWTGQILGTRPRLDSGVWIVPVGPAG